MKKLTARAKAQRPHPLWGYNRIAAPLVSYYRVKQGTVDGIPTRPAQEPTIGNTTQYEGWAAAFIKTLADREKEMATLREFYTVKAAEVGLTLATYCNRFGVKGVLCPTQTNSVMKW